MIKAAKVVIYAFAMVEVNVVEWKVVRRQHKQISCVNLMVVDHDASMKDVKKALKVEGIVDHMVAVSAVSMKVAAARVLNKEVWLSVWRMVAENGVNIQAAVTKALYM